MQNSSQLQFPYPFTSFNIASMFELAAHQQNHLLVNGNGNLNSPPKSPPDSPQNFTDSATAAAMSHFLFPPSFISAAQAAAAFPPGINNNTPHGPHLGHGMIIEDSSCYENGKDFISFNESGGGGNGIKRRSGGKSFTIDSLLGINNVAVARAAVISSHHQLHHHGGLNGLNLTTGSANWVNNRNSSSSGNNHHHNNNNNNINNSNNSTGERPVSKGNKSTNLSSGENTKNKESRKYHPFGNHNSNKNNNNNNNIANTNNISSVEKCEERNLGLRRGTKAKRVRTIFTPEQLERLEAEFERQQYMVGPERLYLASSLHLTEAQVKVWYQNRRIKWRKQHLEMQQQRLAAIRSQQAADLEDVDESGSEYCGSTSPDLSNSRPSSASAIAIQKQQPQPQTPFTNANLNSSTSSSSSSRNSLQPLPQSSSSSSSDFINNNNNNAISSSGCENNNNINNNNNLSAGGDLIILSSSQNHHHQNAFLHNNHNHLSASNHLQVNNIESSS